VRSHHIRTVSFALSLLMGISLGACATGGPTGKLGTRDRTGTTGSSPSAIASVTTTSTSPIPPASEPPAVNPPDTIVHYPNPYAPSYETLDSLFSDASSIVLATVEPRETSTQNYPLLVVQSFLAQARTSMSISPQEFAAAVLRVGDTYVFFYAVDPVDSTDCVVGGVRGVFDYDPSTQIASRIGQSHSSEIPETQTLAQFGTALTAAQNDVSGQSIPNSPPICSPSATGLS
jgi:hypothetical protein